MSKIFKSYNPDSLEDKQMLRILIAHPKCQKLLEFYGTTDKKQEVIDAALDSILEAAPQPFTRNKREYVS